MRAPSRAVWTFGPAPAEHEPSRLRQRLGHWLNHMFAPENALEGLRHGLENRPQRMRFLTLELRIRHAGHGERHQVPRVAHRVRRGLLLGRRVKDHVRDRHRGVQAGDADRLRPGCLHEFQNPVAIGLGPAVTDQNDDVLRPDMGAVIGEVEHGPGLGVEAQRPVQVLGHDGRVAARAGTRRGKCDAPRPESGLPDGRIPPLSGGRPVEPPAAGGYSGTAR